MARQATLPNAENCTLHDLQTAANASPKRNGYVRLTAMIRLLEGYSHDLVAHFSNVTKRTLLNWIKRFNEEGIDGLTDRPRPGAPPKISPEQSEYYKDLIKHPDDFQRAVSKIPPRVLTLQVHAYQSYIFNHLLSKRANLGMSIYLPEVGDFLIKLDETHSGRDTWLYVTESTLEERQHQVESGEYGLALPIPGYTTRLPSTKQSELITQLLRVEGVSLVDFRNPSMKSLDSPGGLHLASIGLPDFDASCSDEGLIVRFSLRKGSYATVVMREIMKNHPINRV